MSRTASEGLALVNEKGGQISLIEINSETDLLQKIKISYFVKNYLKSTSLIRKFRPVKQKYEKDICKR